jgi:hypothetical protein
MAVLFGANVLLGASSSEAALRAFDQHLFDAWTAKVAPNMRFSTKVGGFVVHRRVPVVLFTYYDGQSTVDQREISCASRRSVVLWYGVDATLVWQDGLWFPDRPTVHRRFAETGLLN